MPPYFSLVEEIVSFSAERIDDGRGRRREDPIGLLESYDHESVVTIAVEIGAKLRMVNEERLELLEHLSEAKSARLQMEPLKNAFQELQDAHLLQAKYIQKLQKEQSKIGVYQSTIQMQEKVISKMQKLVEARFRSGRQYGVPNFEQDPDEIDPPMPPNEETATNNITEIAEEILKLNLVLGQERDRFSVKEAELNVAREEIERLKGQIWDLETSARGNSQVL